MCKGEREREGQIKIGGVKKNSVSERKLHFVRKCHCICVCDRKRIRNTYGEGMRMILGKKKLQKEIDRFLEINTADENS